VLPEFQQKASGLSRRGEAGRGEILVIALVVVLCSILGGAFGSRLGSAASASDRSAVDEEVRGLEKVLETVEENYAEPVQPTDIIYDGAIPVLLRSLDPHSMFFDPEAFSRLREEQRGSYAGVGMLIRLYYGETIVDYPFPASPAFEAGVEPGDTIVRINGASTDGLTVEEVAERVRGPEGTSVRLSLRRNGTDDLLELDVVRASIPRPSVPLAFFIEPGIGYVKIQSFGETTADEVDQALRRLSEGKLKGLVLDLRGNQGGLLTAGVRVAERFLQRGQTIVSHRGRASEERVYKARRGQEGKPYPMTVLINCNSASASEIVAGALQDHDRALMVGTNTFGKGLVQSVFDLPDSTGLVLTTARYYTPSGRMIQRPYDNLSQREYYFDPCSPTYDPGTQDPRLTDGGRAVYSGAGIAPDVKLAEAILNPFQMRMAERRAFEGYAQEYSLNTETLPAGWDPDDRLIAGFERYLERQGIAFSRDEFERNLSHIRRMLKKSVYTAVVDYDEAMRVDTEMDPSVRRAIELLPEARALLKDRGGDLARHDSTPVAP
jgi:carboxyl-terminal processing protease